MDLGLEGGGIGHNAYAYEYANRNWAFASVGVGGMHMQ